MGQSLGWQYFQHCAELKERFERWDTLYINGGSDPFWSDGVNLNLIRSHILYGKRKIEEALPDGAYPEIYYRETPPEVDQIYMARTDEIRKNAKIALDALKSNKDYQWLKTHHDAISPKENKQICLDNVLWYAQGLEKAIQDDDLIAMRRKERYQTYLDSFTRCRRDMEKIIEEQEPNLFSLYACARDNTDDSEEFDKEDMILS